MRDCRDSTKFLVEENINMKMGYEIMEKRIAKLRADSTEINTVYNKQKRLYDDLNSLYEQLLKRNENENQKNLGNLKDMEKSLIERERKLRQQEEDMAKKDAANKALQTDIENIDLTELEIYVEENKIDNFLGREADKHLGRCIFYLTYKIQEEVIKERILVLSDTTVKPPPYNSENLSDIVLLENNLVFTNEFSNYRSGYRYKDSISILSSVLAVDNGSILLISPNFLTVSHRPVARRLHARAQPFQTQFVPAWSLVRPNCPLQATDPENPHPGRPETVWWSRKAKDVRLFRDDL